MNFYYYFYFTRVGFSRILKCDWVKQSGNKYTFCETDFYNKTIRKKPTVKLFFDSSRIVTDVEKEIYANSLRIAIMRYRGEFEEGGQFFNGYQKNLLPYFVYDEYGKQLFSL